MKYIVTVQKCTEQSDPNIPGQAFEVFRQGLDELDLSKFVVALNQKPRGRPSRPAKKESAA